MTKMAIYPEDRTITNTYVPNNKATKYMKQKLNEMKGEIGNSKIILGGFHTPLAVMCRTAREKTNKEMEGSIL